MFYLEENIVKLKDMKKHTCPIYRYYFSIIVSNFIKPSFRLVLARSNKKKLGFLNRATRSKTAEPNKCYNTCFV